MSTAGRFRGGSQTLVDALAARLSSLGGEIVTSSTVDELPRADVVLCDLAPREFAHRGPDNTRLVPAGTGVQARLGARRPDSVGESSQRSAGTVHVGGRFAEIADSERAPWEGARPARGRS
jgi:phytoene dehydrogenase-like protein